MKRLARIEVGLALASAGLAVVASVYFIVSLLGEREVCYGMRADKLVCQGVTFQTAERMALVLVTMLVLVAGGAAGAWLHQRAKERTARNAGLGVLCMCALFVLCMTVPALSGAGIYLVPSMVMLLAAAALGLYPAALDTWHEIASEMSGTGGSR